MWMGAVRMRAGGSVIMDSLSVLMLDWFQLLSSPDVNWWTGVLWCFYQLSFWRHPFTAEHPLLDYCDKDSPYNQHMERSWSGKHVLRDGAAETWGINTYIQPFSVAVHCSSLPEDVVHNSAADIASLSDYRATARTPVLMKCLERLVHSGSTDDAISIALHTVQCHLEHIRTAFNTILPSWLFWAFSTTSACGARTS